MYRGAVSFEFDPKKAVAIGKHGVSFAEAEPVLFDPLALTREDTDAVAEQRFLTLGTGAQGRVLMVRGAAIRVISARLATAHERKCYES